MLIVENAIYTAPISYIIGTYIREYDISKANINILYHENKLKQTQYNFLYSCPKIQREIYIGKMIKNNPELYTVLKNGIRKFRVKLYTSNSLNDSDILSIKNDALFIIDKELMNTKFDNIQFLLKNIYTSYYKIYNMEFYFDRINDKLDVKGMGDSLKYHEEYFGDLLKFLMSEAETHSPEVFIKTIRECINSFVHYEYPIQYYREFNNRSNYKSKIRIANESYYMNTLPEDSDPSMIDISFNYGILYTLYSYTQFRILNF